MAITAPKWAQSNRFWQALSLVLGCLYLWERFEIGEKLRDRLLEPVGSAEGASSSANAAARRLCNCPKASVLNSSSLAPVPLQALLAGPVATFELPDGGAVSTETLGRMLGSLPAPSPPSSGCSGDYNSTNSSGSDSHASDAHAAGHGGHGAHPHVALFYLLIAILIGTVVLHLMILPMFHGLQQTVILFILGVIFSAMFEGLHVNDDVFGASHAMWMQIDPHLLLYTMLPALLTGDAITIDTSIARKVGRQCIYLAGPGVLLGAFGIAGFLHLYFQWDFLLCLVTGSILSATDPVAVVGLLKELGASPTLTVQIQGESLLNDGTAIVLYLLAYQTYGGSANYDAGDIIIFLVRMALAAVALGWVIGYIFLCWIRLACKRLEHHAGLIQTTLTICCAYSSFAIAEGLLHISGVLSTVASALVLADKMWPSIVEKEGLHQVWHMLEYLGNTIIFFLAGGLTGKVLTTIGWRDLLDLFLLYLICTLVRGMVIICSRPILGYLNESNQTPSIADALIMTWGGLRGAVGLALAVQVNIDRIEGKIDAEKANKVLFFVAGMAFLTLAVNATTSPALVRMLGVTRTPKAKQQMLFRIHAQMKRLEAHKDNPKVVHTAVKELMDEAYHHIEKLVKDKMRRTSSLLSPGNGLKKGVLGNLSGKASVFRKGKMVIPSLYVNELLEAKKFLKTIPSRRLKLLQVPRLHGDSYDEMVCDIAKGTDTKEQELEVIMVHSMNEALLYLVRSEYWHLIETGEFVDGSTDSELLLHSVRLGIDQVELGQTDLAKLKRHLKFQHEKVLREESDPDLKREDSGSHSRSSTASNRGSGRWSHNSDHSGRNHTHNLTYGGFARSTSIGRVLLVDFEKEKSPLMKFTDSVPFNIFMGLMIFLNVVYIIIEQTEVWQNEGATWGLELFFVSIFCLEFLIKLIAWRCSYFGEAWNVFDFVLVIIGLVGLVFLGMMQGTERSSQEDMQEARMFRINRVFRVLRIIRIFRLLNFARVLYAKFMKKEFCLELAEQLQSITVLKAFVKAHMHGQEKLLEYFGKDGKPSTPEVAIAILQSLTQVHRALYLAGKELEFVDPAIIKNVNIQRKVFVAAQELSDFVLKAHHDGVITARMAETILHPVRNHMRVIDRMLSEVQSGMRGRAGKITDSPSNHEGENGLVIGDHGSEDGFYGSDDAANASMDYDDIEVEDSEGCRDLVDEGDDDGFPPTSAEIPSMPVRQQPRATACIPSRLGHLKMSMEQQATPTL